MKGLIYRNLYDKDGAIVSNDGRTLFKVPDVPHYRIREGIEVIGDQAFKNLKHLKMVDIPYTVEWYTDDIMSNDAMHYAPRGLKVRYWNWPYPENCIRSEELEEEIAKGFVDELGAVYSKDRKRLLKCADVKNYKVKEGTETVDRLAFVGCDELEHLYLPYTCPEETFDAILGGTDVIGAISFWIMPYVDDDMNDDASWLEYDDVAIDEYDVAYTKNGKRLLFARIGFTNSDYYVPEGTVTICSNAFGFCEQYVVLSVPSTVKVIGDDIFGNGGGKIVFRDEKK